MALRRIIFSAQSIIQQSRCFSSNLKYLDVSLNDKNGVATVTLNRPPVNSLNLDFLNEFITLINNLEKQRVSGMIITSFNDKIFSAGLDLTEVYKPTKERLTSFWKALQELWPLLYNSSFPTAALITGHAPAGGCLIAIGCEYRVMVKDFTIGLSEARLGIPVPIWASLNMVNIIGRRNAELALTTGRMFTTEEALKIGLVDEIASDRACGLEKIEGFFKRFNDVPPIARKITKQDLKSDDIERMNSRKEKETDFMVNYLMQPKFQSKLEMYLAMLKNKSS